MEHGSGRVHLSNFDKGRDFSSYALYSTVDIEKWHSRIGHPSDIIMNNEMSCINGSSITGNSKCTSCPLGKSHKLPFHSQHVKALKSFDLIYADLYLPLFLLQLSTICCLWMITQDTCGIIFCLIKVYVNLLLICLVVQ